MALDQLRLCLQVPWNGTSSFNSIFIENASKKTEGDAHEVGDCPVKVYRLHISYKASEADKYTIRVVWSWTIGYGR